MFNSFRIVKTSIELNSGKFSSNDPLVKALHDLHLDIVRTEIEMWQDQGGTNEAFAEWFDDAFPSGFIRRDIERAKNVIYDLYDIAVSPVLRFELSPINTYVMCELIDRWFDEDEFAEERYVVPNDLKTYLCGRNISIMDYESVVSWFTNRSSCVNDFIETYNGDYVKSRFIEEVAGFYLSGGRNSPELRMLGVTIDEFFDLLPNDLRELCVQKYEREKKTMDTNMLSANGSSPNPVVFISYSWDSEQHKMWVKELSGKLIENGIQVILDQNDLVLGDPLPHFMEQSIVGSDYVLIICTPQYKQKADARKGGVGYEESIISADIFASQNNWKYITVLAEGTWGTSTPIWAVGKYGVNLSNRHLAGEEFEKLVNGLKR